MSEMQMYLDIGKIVALHQRKLDLRFHYRLSVKNAEKNLKEAKAGDMAYGGYEDCGSFYKAALIRAEGAVLNLQEMNNQIIRLDKFVKMSIHRFHDNYPSEEAKKVLSDELGKAIKETREYLSNKGNSDYSKELKRVWNIC